MKRYLLLTVIALLLGNVVVKAQLTVYFEEGFEGTTLLKDRGWLNDTTGESNTLWAIYEGGADNQTNPEFARVGLSNAGVFFRNLILDTINLITPEISLDGAVDPVIHFWYCQYESIKGNDMLELLFRQGPNSPWHSVKNYFDPANGWKEIFIEMADEGYNYFFTDSFQIGFNAVIGNGYGVYLDDFSVVDSADIPRYIKSVEFEDIDQKALIAGSKDVPVKKVNLRVLGNVGDMLLDSLVFEPVGDGITFLEQDSFKLYNTAGDVFKQIQADTSTVIGTGSLQDGKIVFPDLGRKMFMGDNYFWLTISIKDSISGKPAVRFDVPQYGINASDTLLPEAPITDGLNHLLSEVAFFDDFDGEDKGWIFDAHGDFEFGTPDGDRVGTKTNPALAFSGTNVLATNVDGGYFAWINDIVDPYYAYMPEQNLKYYINLDVFMYTWSSFTSSTVGVIEASNDGGNTWVELWNSVAKASNSQWTAALYDNINEMAERQEQFQVRIGINESTSDIWPGFAIDNFALLGEKLYRDVAVGEIFSPYTDCITCTNDTVKAVFKNLASIDAPDTIPVFYGLWGMDSTLIYDTIFGGIPVDDSVIFSFNTLAPFPVADEYPNFVVGSALPGDQYTANDTAMKSFIIQEQLEPDALTSYEDKAGLWVPSDSSGWTNKDMSLTIDTDPSSPHIWVIGSTGNYMPNDDSYVKSGCYDFTGEKQHIVQLEYYSNSVEGEDGARIEYSYNNDNWFALEDAVHASYWNWPTEHVSALGSNGWSGQAGCWMSARALLPEAIDTAKQARFRLRWMTDEAGSFPQGFAINNFEVFKAPVDMGVAGVAIKDTCLFETSEQVIISVKNYGYNDIKENDTVIIGFDLEGAILTIDTLLAPSAIIPGDSSDFTVNVEWNVNTAGIKNIKAYTLSEADPWYYGTNNDTLISTFEIWPLPDPMMVDTIQSRQPDTVLMQSNPAPEMSYLWSNGATTDTTSATEGDGVYYLTITESIRGCSNYDSTFVELLYNNIGVESFVTPVDACSFTDNEEVIVRVKNFGTDSLIVGDNFTLTVTLDGTETIKDTITLTEKLDGWSHMDYTMKNGTFDLSEIRQYNIEVVLYSAGDADNTNNTISQNFNVFGYPTVDLGNDTLIEAASMTLDAGAGFDGYMWNTGDTTQTIEVFGIGTYDVAVTDNNGCTSRDTIYVHVKARDIKPTQLLTPMSDCENTSAESVKMQFTNTGSDTLTSNDTIHLQYTVNGGPVVEEKVVFSEFLPGAVSEYTFTNTVDMFSSDDYVFNVITKVSSDIRNWNDTIIDTVKTHYKPEPDLGPEILTVYSDEIELDAGIWPNAEYLWDNDATTQKYTVKFVGDYGVLVTDTVTGCSGMDLIRVNFDKVDFIAKDIHFMEPVCKKTYDTVYFEVVNGSQRNREDDTLLISYKLNNGDYFESTHIVTETWKRDSSKLFAVGPVDLNGLTNFNLFGTVHVKNDNKSDNDTIEVVGFPKQAPYLDLGSDVVLWDESPILLDAGAGHASYLWHNSSEARTFNVTESGMYYVAVTSLNACISRDTIYITTEPEWVGGEKVDYDMNLKLYPNPANGYFWFEANMQKDSDYVLELYDGNNRLILIDKWNGTGTYRNQYDISMLNKGIYFIRVRNDETYKVTKLIIN